MGRVTEQSSLERGDDSRIRLFEWFLPPALKMACSQRRNVHLLPRRRSSHFPSLRTTLRAPGPSKSPTARLPVGLQFLNRGITKIPEKESTPVGVDIEFYFDSRQCCEKKKTAIDRYGRANRPDHSKTWDKSLWAYRWWGRSLSPTRHQPRWTDDKERRFEVGPEAGTVPSGRAQPVGGLALSSPARCAFGFRDSRRCIFGLEAGSRKVETLLASHPT